MFQDNFFVFFRLLYLLFVSLIFLLSAVDILQLALAYLFLQFLTISLTI